MVGGWCYTSASNAPDGQTLATACADGTATLWPLPQGKPRRFSHDYTLNLVRFSPDGKLLLTCGGEGQVRLWELASGLPLSPPLPHDSDLDPVFTSQGDLVTVLAGRARVWNLQPWGGKTRSKRLSSVWHLDLTLGLAAKASQR